MSKPTVPTVFWVISIIAVIWNLMGLAAFAGDLFVTPEMLATMNEATPGYQELYESTPSWMKIVYGAATICGLLGSIFLVIRKKWAIPLFVLSLIAVIIQMGYSLFATNATEVLGTTNAVVMPVLVICIAAFLVYYARKSEANEWIS